ncbi:hypothetical protein ACOMHN_057536 [Nucella lapillus]
MQYLITDYNGRHSRWQGVRCPCSIPDGKVSDAHAAFQMARCQMPMQHSRWQGVRCPCSIPDGKVSDAHASSQMARCQMPMQDQPTVYFPVALLHRHAIFLSPVRFSL